MIKKTKGNISFFQSEKLVNHSEIIHLFSTRNSGVSKGVFESLNFGTQHGEEENMKTNGSNQYDEKKRNFSQLLFSKYEL
jgi:copper oxidase (laccase) domain-containing protein